MPKKNKTVVNINITINYNTTPAQQEQPTGTNKWIKRLEIILKWFGL